MRIIASILLVAAMLGTGTHSLNAKPNLGSSLSNKEKYFGGPKPWYQAGN